MTGQLYVTPVHKTIASAMVVAHHYLHRRPSISFAFGLFSGGGEMVGVLTLGCPPSRHLQISVCPSAPQLVVELNRLFVFDSQPKNTESWFIARALKMLPLPRLVCSYADTAAGHTGYVYRASNWHYAGLTDQDRKTPRYDYVPLNGKHSRDAFRSGEFTRVRRLPKHRYWTATGNKRERRDLEKLCGWPKLGWKS